MAYAKKPASKAPAASKPLPSRAAKPAPAPEQDTEPPFDEYECGEVEEVEESPRQQRPASRAPQRPAPQRDEPRQKMSGFPEGSLFEGDSDSVVIFAGTFNPDELHALIDEAAQNSTDPERIRIKIFDVDDQYQKGPKRRVRINFAGLQPRQQGGRGTNTPWGRRATGGGR